MKNLLLLLVAWLWRALVMKFGVDWLSSDESPARAKATYGATLTAALGFSVLGAVLGYAAVFGPIAILIGLAIYCAAWIWLFGTYFGLGWKNALVMVLVQWAGNVLLWAILRLLPVGCVPSLGWFF